MSDAARAPHAALLFGLARRLAPNRERAWLDDMKLEYAFVPGRVARMRWLFGVVGFALRLRAATFGDLKPSQRLWFTTLASILFVAVVVSPIAVRPPTAEMSSQPDVSQEFQFGGTSKNDAETDTATNTEAGEPSAVVPTRAARAAAPLSPSPVALPTEPPAEAEVTSETTASKMADALADTAAADTSMADAPRDANAQVGTTDLDTADLNTAALTTAALTTEALTTEAVNPVAAPSALAQEPTVAEIPAAAPIVTVVESDTVTLRLTRVAWLELRQGGANGPLLQEGTFETGQTLSVQVPFYLTTSNAGGVGARAGAADLGHLGDVGEAQTRLFVRP
ncbi:hypothetical protein BH24DEI2_BH24DEI2_09860 [soil metagenome]